MLKNKTTLLLIILIVITIALSPLSFADNETTEDKAQNAITQEITQNTTSQEETQDSTTQSETSDETQDVAQNSTSAEKEVAEEAVQEQAIAQESASQLQNIKSGDQYLFGESITVDYIVDGNLYVMANDVTISSQIVGSAFIMANKITITEEGYIAASLYALGSDIEIKGFAYDAYTTSQNLTISGYVYRDLHSASSQFNLYGAVGRDASISAQSLNFVNPSASNSETQSPTTNTGKIMGDLNYSAENEIQIPENVVYGNVTYHQEIHEDYSPDYVFLAISSVIFVVAIWGLFKLFAPKFVANTNKLITNNPLKTVGLGLLGLIAIPIIAVIVMLTGIAASIGLLLLAAYIILICISRSICIFAINNIVANKLKFETTAKNVLLLIVTSLVAWAITFIPVAGALINLAFVIIGIGIVIRSLACKEK